MALKLTESDIETARDFGSRAAIARHQGDESRAHEHTLYIRRLINLYDKEDADKLHAAFNDAYKEESKYYYNRGY
jgi:hypothetical protein